MTFLIEIIQFFVCSKILNGRILVFKIFIISLFPLVLHSCTQNSKLTYCTNHFRLGLFLTHRTDFTDSRLALIGSYFWFLFLLIFTAQCTLVHLRGLGIACRPSVCLSVRL